MRKSTRWLIVAVVLSLFFLVGCEFVEESTQTKTAAPEVCAELNEEFIADVYSMNNDDFNLNDNPLLNGYSYDVKKDENGRVLNFPHLSLNVWEGKLPCRLGNKVGENTNYFYCDPFPISKRVRVIDDEGVLTKDTETFYVVEGMILRFKEDITKSIGGDDFKTGERWEVVSRECYQTRFADYS